MKNNKILINIPDLSKPGGVSGLYNILNMEQYFPNVSLFCIHGKLPTILRIPIKYLQFGIKLRSVNTVHLNPSLNKKSFLRDALFAWITLIFSRKLIVYWHGWDNKYETKIRCNLVLGLIAKKSLLKAQTSIVLGTVFKEKLRDMGCKGTVHIETNTAEDKYLTTKSPKKIRQDDEIRLLFLSRLEKAKGIYIAIQTLKILNRSSNRYKLIIAGSGSEEQSIIKIIAEDSNIEWAGYISGEVKHKLIATSHIMFFPSYYPEGLPLTLLEGMMYGLPIVSRPIGGIPDIIKNEENGFLLESINPDDFANKIKSMADKPNLYEQISINNIEKSQIFSPRKVRERLYKIYETI